AIFAYLAWQYGRREQPSGAPMRNSWKFIAAAVFASIAYASLEIGLYSVLPIKTFFGFLIGPTILLILIWIAFLGSRKQQLLTSEVQRLTNEIRTTKDSAADQISRMNTQHAAEEYRTHE